MGTKLVEMKLVNNNSVVDSNTKSKAERESEAVKLNWT